MSEAPHAEFAARLRKLREKAGWTQSDLARAADAGRVNVNQWEGGRNLPRDTALRKLAAALGVSVEYLLTGKDTPGLTVQEIIAHTRFQLADLLGVPHDKIAVKIEIEE